MISVASHVDGKSRRDARVWPMSLCFGSFELNLAQYRLQASGRPVEVQPKVLELLAHLVENSDRIVSKDELLSEVWHSAHVSESALSRAVGAARRALERGGGGRDWITTVYGRGFRFTGPEVRDVSAHPAPTGFLGATAEPISIAVLPFGDHSEAQDQAYFCSGLADEILNRLARLPELLVTARGVSFRFEPGADPREVGRELGVRYVLAGVVRKDEQALRIDAELTDVASGFRAWSKQWDRLPSHVLAVQDQIAAEVLEALGVRFASSRLERAARPRQARSARAYDHYLRGRNLFMEGRRATYYEACRHYEAALEEDPAYALAYAGLADCLSYLYQFHELSGAHRDRAEQASARALDLAPNVAEAHAARALALHLHARTAEAEHHFRRALELDASSYEANYHFARHCFVCGRFEEALDLFDRAAAADPAAYAPCNFAGQVCGSLGDPHGALRWRKRCLKRVKQRLLRYPDDQRAICLGAGSLAEIGDRDEALEWARRAEQLDPHDPVALYNIACVASRCGEVVEGLDYLERAIAAGFPELDWIENDSDLDDLRSVPRYTDVIAPLAAGSKENLG